MIGSKASATGGSTSVGGDNLGTITNISMGEGSVLSVSHEAEVQRGLPSHLGAIIALFAQGGSLAAEATTRRQLPPEVADKLRHNNLPTRHPIIEGWIRHSLSLERTYLGVEQQNPDARYLVKQRAGMVYGEELLKAAESQGILHEELCGFARQNAVALVTAVTDRLFAEYCASQAQPVEMEVARLAVSLIVADAVLECEVLERPDHVAAP
jgi:hypothetical protein